MVSLEDRGEGAGSYLYNHDQVHRAHGFRCLAGSGIIEAASKGLDSDSVLG